MVRRLRLSAVLLLGAVLRIGLLSTLAPQTLDALASRVELASPSTSLASLTEAIYLARAYHDRQQKSHQSDGVGGSSRTKTYLARITSPNPWSSGHVHHSPVLVYALTPLVQTKASELHLKPSQKNDAIRSRRKQKQKRDSQFQPGGALSAWAAIEARLFQLYRDLPDSLRATLEHASSRLDGVGLLLTLLDLVAAIALAAIEVQRAAWRNKYARIRGLRQAELDVRAKYLAQQRAEDEKEQQSKTAAGGRGERSSRRQELETEEEDRSVKVAALYLFNPLVLLSTLARTTTMIYTTCTLLSVLFAVTLSGRVARKNKNRSGTGLISILLVLTLSFNIVVSFYPLLMTPALLMLATTGTAATSSASSAVYSHSSSGRGKRLTLILFTFVVTLLLLGISLLLPTGLGGADGHIHGVLSQVYLHLLSLSDLTPNIGLWWYFFTEMFDHFRSFFLLAFNVHLASYSIPLCIKYASDPLFAVTLLSGITTVFKSYPTVGDTALYLAMLSLHPEVYPCESSASVCVAPSPFHLTHLLMHTQTCAIRPSHHYCTLTRCSSCRSSNISGCTPVRATPTSSTPSRSSGRWQERVAFWIPCGPGVDWRGSARGRLCRWMTTRIRRDNAWLFRRNLFLCHLL